MKNIKFRAWDKQEKRMMYMQDYKPQTFFEDLFALENGKKDLFPQHTMQYTGLKDKNGVEIYEGDILRWWVKSLNKFSTDYLEVRWGDSGYVLFSKLFSSFGLPNGSTCSSDHIIDYIRNSEVIGNIYQNPELLQQQQPY